MNSGVPMDKIGVHLLDKDASPPTRAHSADAGWDLYASKPTVILPGERAVVSTGIGLDIPEGWVVQVCSRSGLAAKYGICVLNAPGIIDAGYQGEVAAILANLGCNPFEIRRGDRIAQLVLLQIPKVELAVVASASPVASDRGVSGFGSSGR